MSIRPPIADDEPLARQGIRGFLRHHSDIEVTQECFDEESAAAAILEQQPDLVFLHVQMPELGDQGVGGSKVQRFKGSKSSLPGPILKDLSELTVGE